MAIKFDKMHALGNDFVLIDLEPLEPAELTNEFYKRISDRHFGVGCDTVVTYRYRDGIVFASFINCDGTEAEICGNAARCIGALMKMRHGVSSCVLKTRKQEYTINLANNLINVDMGVPSFQKDDIGIVGDLSKLKSQYFNKMFCVSIGNPHLVVFPDEPLSDDEIRMIGAQLESSDTFANRINVSFAYPLSEDRLSLSVFERGVGLTMACGSGACATSYVAYRNGLIPSNRIYVEQKGGALQVTITEDNRVWQAGSATYVFCGEI